jgi:hypothetical protein
MTLIEFKELSKNAREEFQQGVGQSKSYARNYQEFNRLRNLNNRHYLHFIQNFPMLEFYQSPRAVDNRLKAYGDSLLRELYRPSSTLFTQWTDFRRVPVKTDFE